MRQTGRQAGRGAGSRASEQVFSAEIPIRMRIDMRIRHGNAIGEIGPGTLEGAYNFFSPVACDCRSRSAGRMRGKVGTCLRGR